MGRTGLSTFARSGWDDSPSWSTEMNPFWKMSDVRIHKDSNFYSLTFSAQYRMRINNEIKSRMVAYYHTPQHFPFAFKHKEPRFVLTPSHLFLSSTYFSSRLATASQRATKNPAQMRAKGNHWATISSSIIFIQSTFFVHLSLYPHSRFTCLLYRPLDDVLLFSSFPLRRTINLVIVWASSIWELNGIGAIVGGDRELGYRLTWFKLGFQAWRA